MAKRPKPKGIKTRKLNLAYELGGFVGPCGKVAYRSRSEANKALKRLAKDKKDERSDYLQVYQCRVCEDCWHVGHGYFKH